MGDTRTVPGTIRPSSSTRSPASGERRARSPGSLNTDGSAQVFSVSCTSDGNCAAGGRYKDSSGNYQAFVVDEVAGVWGTASEVAGSLNTGGLARVWSVSCTSDGNCAAGGRYKESSGNSQAFVVDEVGGAWGTPSEVAGSLNTGGDAWINSISCTSAGICVAGGYYKDGSGNYQAFVVDEVAGTWGTPSEVTGSLNAGGDGETNSVSCTSDGYCEAGGFYKDGSGNIQAFVVDDVFYAVTFDANGGSGTMSAESYAAGVAKALTANAFTFTGYTFTGWNTAANGSGTAYTDGATYPFNANVTLYAQWSANSEDVSFDANGGSGTMSAESYTTGVAKALTANAFTFTGHTFTGWNTARQRLGHRLYRRPDHHDQRRHLALRPVDRQANAERDAEGSPVDRAFRCAGAPAHPPLRQDGHRLREGRGQLRRKDDLFGRTRRWRRSLLSEFITARLRESPAPREVRSVRFLPFPQQIHRRAGGVALGHHCYLNPVRDSR